MSTTPPPQRSREYLAPSFVGEAALRLLVTGLGAFLLGLAIMSGLEIETVTEVVFQRGLQQDAQRVFNKKIIREGGGQISVWDRFAEAREKDPSLRYADLHAWLARQSFLAGEDEDVLLWARFQWEYRVACAMLCAGAGLVGLLLLLLMYSAYGGRQGRSALGRWLFGLANPDYARLREGERVLVKDFSPLHRKIFDLSYRLARNNSQGEFLYVLDEFARLLSPHEDDLPRGRVDRIGLAFAELAEDRFYFEHRRGRHGVAREFRLLRPMEGRYVCTELPEEGEGAGRSVYEAGVFRIDGELFQELLKDKFPRPPDQTLFTLDEESHEYAYEIMALVEDYFGQPREGRELHLWEGEVLWLPLRRLLSEGNVNLIRTEASKSLGKIHRDLDHLVERGFLTRWSIRDGEGDVPRDWASSSYLFTVNPTTHRREVNWPVITEKRYGFEVPESAGSAADTLRLEPSPALRLLHLTEGPEDEKEEELVGSAPVEAEGLEDGSDDDGVVEAVEEVQSAGPEEEKDEGKDAGERRDGGWMTRALRDSLEDDD